MFPREVELMLERTVLHAGGEVHVKHFEWSAGFFVVTQTCAKLCGSGDCAVVNGSEQCVCHRGYELDRAGICVGKSAW